MKNDDLLSKFTEFIKTKLNGGEVIKIKMDLVKKLIK